MKRLWLLLLLAACELPTPVPTPTTSTTLSTSTTTSSSTTTTTLELPKTGEVVISKIKLKLGNRPFDFKLDSNQTGHLIIGEKGYFTYQTYSNRKFSEPMVVKDEQNQVIAYATKDTRFRAPKITVLKGTPYLFWGEKESDGLRLSKLENNAWSKPVQILGTQWVEYLDVLTFKDTMYLAHVNVDGVIHFTKYDGSKFIEYASEPGNKDVGSYVGQDEAWFMSRFRDGVLYPISNPSQKIVFKGASFPQAVILPNKDYHAAFIVGKTRKLNNNNYYYPHKIVYKSVAREVNVYQFPEPTDQELLAGSNFSSKWLEVSGEVGITIIGGKPLVIYDIKKVLYVAKISGSNVEISELGNGQSPLTRSLINSAILINQGEHSHYLEVK